MTKTILITGANRGLGLEFVRQYAKEDTFIMACCRSLNEASDLEKLKAISPNKIKIYQLDVTSEHDINKLSKEIESPIDILLNNAGMLEKEVTFGDFDQTQFSETFLVNAFAPLRLAEAFRDHVAKSKMKLIASLSSSMGSIADNSSGGYYSYRMSKAALNMGMKSAAYDLMTDGIKVLLLHPGWVKTRMGGADAQLDPEVSIQGMRQVIASYNPPAGEVFFHRYNGEIVPW